MHFVDKHTAAGYREISAPRHKNSNYTVNPLLTLPGAYLFQTCMGGGGFIETGGLVERGGLLNLAMVVVSALHKRLEGKVEELKYKKV